MIKLSYFDGVTDNRGKKLTRDAFWDLIHGPRMKWDIEAIRKGEEGRKRGLPGVTWQANYEGKRANDTAQATGLFMLDIDHLGKAPNHPEVFRQAKDPVALLWELTKSRIDELGIVCFHRSPSGDGAHIVALCEPRFQDIASNQAWLAGMLGVPYDAACHDWARLGFLSVADDFYYIDWDTLFDC